MRIWLNPVLHSSVSVEIETHVVCSRTTHSFIEDFRLLEDGFLLHSAASLSGLSEPPSSATQVPVTIVFTRHPGRHLPRVALQQTGHTPRAPTFIVSFDDVWEVINLEDSKRIAVLEVGDLAGRYGVYAPSSTSTRASTLLPHFTLNFLRDPERDKRRHAVKVLAVRHRSRHA
jgi:hypothetical protein